MAAPREANNWVVTSLEWSYHTSDPAQSETATWHNNIVIKVVDPKVGLLYSWPSPDDQAWNVTYTHQPKGPNGAPKPVWVTVGHGGYVEFEVWFDKKNEPDPTCTFRINLDPPDPTRWIWP